MAGYRLSDRYDVLDVRYHFDPALRRAPRRPSRPLARPCRAISAIGSTRMREPVRLGFYNGLADLAPMPMPWSDAMRTARRR